MKLQLLPLEPLGWAALKVATRTLDEHLPQAPKGQGQEIDLALRLVGSVDVNEDSSAAVATSPDVLQLLAHAVELTPKTRREAFLQGLAERYAANAPIADETLAVVKTLKADLTTRTMKPRRGVITGIVELGLYVPGRKKC
jgi:hypothetical protein